MKWMISGLLSLWIATGVVVGSPEDDKAEPSEATKVLEKSAEALTQVKFARYDAAYKGTGWATQYVPTIEGSVVLGEPSEYDILRFRCEVKLTPTGSEETLEYVVGSDGDLHFLIDAKEKMVYADMDEAVLGTRQRDLQRALLRDFVAKEPLANDIKAEKVELKDVETVDGVECQQVHVTYGETREAVWFISKKDQLPRRVVRVYKNDKGEIGTTELTLSELKVSKKVDLTQFKLTVPEGYKRTDDFAS
ncbi:MAG: DUF2092 domain-containing protein [Phycisphaerales bacterium]|nr:MAG: DUF2092 domain-containing protein [Phycisphaerales bacterium]